MDLDIISRDGVTGVIQYNKFTFSYELTCDSSVADLKSAICVHWKDLSPLVFDIFFERDGKRHDIVGDGDLQSFVWFSCKSGQRFVSIFLSLKKMSIVRYNEIASSSSSCIEDDEEICRPALKSNGWENVFTGVGQIFSGGAIEVRNKLRQFSIETGFKYTLLKNHKNRVKAVCKRSMEEVKLNDEQEKCKWMIYAVSYGTSGGPMKMQEMVGEHTCGNACKDYKNPMVSSALVMSLILGEVNDNILVTPKKIIDNCKREYGIELKYYYAYTARLMAIKEIYGDVGLSYNQLSWYKDAILETNPGSRVLLEVDPATKKFQRFFVAFEASIYGFRFCRPMLCLDGTFMKTKYKGCILSATAKNGDDGMFTVAFAVVEVENDSNWLWFLQNLKEVVAPDRPITFLSDRHCSLVKNVRLVFPDCHHSFCMWHLKNNLAAAAARFSNGENLRVLFGRCAYAATHLKYMQCLKDLLAAGGDKTAKFMRDLPPQQFANAYFTGRRYGELCSNIAESFNHWIIEERSMPICAMLDRIRSRVMSMMAERHDLSWKWTSILCPKMEEKLAKRIQEARPMKVLKSSEFVYEVHLNKQHSVRLAERICSCGKWAINGFPCKHAVAAIIAKGDRLYDYVESYFYVTTFRETYSHAIQPVPNDDKPIDGKEEPAILPPDLRRPPGRPKNKRIPNTGSNKRRRTQKCSSCLTTSHHNRRTCPNL